MLQVQKLIHQAGYFVDIDTSDRTMQKKVRVAQLAQYNYILVVGEEEASSGKQKLVPGISCTIPSHLVVECYKLLKFSRQHPIRLLSGYLKELLQVISQLKKEVKVMSKKIKDLCIKLMTYEDQEQDQRTKSIKRFNPERSNEEPRKKFKRFITREHLLLVMGLVSCHFYLLHMQC